MAFKNTFGLDRIRVEHKSLGPTQPFVCTLPKPISVNAMFGQAPGRKRFHSAEYSTWIENATLRLKCARPPKFKGQIWIAIMCEDTGRSDIDNKAKGILDLLVREGVIEDDSRNYVRELRLTWGNVTGCRVEVRPTPFEQARAA